MCGESPELKWRQSLGICCCLLLDQFSGCLYSSSKISFNWFSSNYIGISFNFNLLLFFFLNSSFQCVANFLIITFQFVVVNCLLTTYFYLSCWMKMCFNFFVANFPWCYRIFISCIMNIIAWSVFRFVWYYIILFSPLLGLLTYSKQLKLIPFCKFCSVNFSDMCLNHRVIFIGGLLAYG